MYFNNSLIILECINQIAHYLLIKEEGTTHCWKIKITLNTRKGKKDIYIMEDESTEVVNIQGIETLSIR
jgi:hypothetical protein